VDVVRATGAGQILRIQVVNDFIESFLEAVLVALDELQHAGRVAPCDFRAFYYTC